MRTKFCRRLGSHYWLCCCSLGVLLALCESSLGEQDTQELSVRLEEHSTDPSAGNLACYKIETPAATYFLEKEGLGLSSLLDTEGVDWIGFRPEKGSGASGEYRGFPNAVFKKGGSFFHPLNAGTDHSTSSVKSISPERVSIVGVSGNGEWECRWDFFATHCTFTMTKMPAGRKFWALYEGAPGGQCDDNDWWMTSAIQEKMPLDTPHEGDIPAPEWIAFGDTRLGRTLFVLHEQDDEQLDQFYLMRKSMTVFGFGRKKLEKYIDSVPQSFSLGILEKVDHQEIAERIESLCLEQ